VSDPSSAGGSSAGGSSAGGPGAGAVATVSLGLDVGGTKMLGVALDPGGTVLAEARRPSPQPPRPAPAPPTGEPEGAGALVEAVAELVGELRRAVEAGGHPAPGAVGIGVPGLVDDEGRLRAAPNLPAGEGLPVPLVLGARLGVEVVADNDAACAAEAEWRMGAAAGASEALVVTLGTGIGGGLVCGGKVVRGAQGFAGEVGHMVVDPSGPRCTCGKRGCWERFASGSGLARLAREAAHAGRLASVVHLAGDDPEAVRGEHVASAAAAGDPEAQAVLDELGWWIGLGLANLANVLDPEVVVVGGGLFAALPLVLGPARRAFGDMLEGAERRAEIPIVPAALGERAGAVGAALMAGGQGRHAGARSGGRP
jgi:glucokinase